MHYDLCPYCQANLLVHNKRWNGTCRCPNCNKDIEVDFDMIVLEDNDEWDIITLKKKEDQDFGADIFECELANEEDKG